MTTENWSSRLPTLDRLGLTAPPTDVHHVALAQRWLEELSTNIAMSDIDGILGLICDEGLWRDVLALTWDIRTFDGVSNIRTFLADRLDLVELRDLKLKGLPVLQQPFPDLIWIIAMFEFTTKVGSGSGVFRLVPTTSGEWKAYTVFTNLEGLTGFPEKIGPLRARETVSSALWAERRARNSKFANEDPSVVIIGGGQSGLALAARLKYIGVSYLIIEKDSRVGDSWRKRYDNLCLHFPVWWDSMPYIPFPPTWPVYTPGFKMAEWLESYANNLDLNIWTSSTVLSAIQDSNNKWNVHVQCPDGAFRVFHANHLVFATGMGDGVPKAIDYPGQDIFQGQIIHSTQYKRASAYIGKKVIVIGAGNSAHDICADLAENGVDVTMFQRSSTMVFSMDRGWKFLGGALYGEGSPPIEIADCLALSMPQILQENGLDVLDKLRGVGFRVNNGMKDAGVALQNKEKGGGYFFDTGASQLIIDGKIKLKNDAQIKKFEKDGLVFDNESKLVADAIICATGLGDMRESIRMLCGDKIANNCPRLLGVDKEGEMSWYRALPYAGLWYMIGPFSLNRFYSKSVALQIKAMDENILDSRYSPK
ncbi:hypothetical protein BDZ94DRAFT_1284124 [Collybia nuda]|uniref:Flavin-containing monooxygenase n=1 Tax=Collybia nuda TaxID=64659 RepID=A0A9P5Y0H7_9AGAR|nr:hypothetical protein BDZ94DRAFT_1284124 [Collybia nuda]